MKNRASRLHKPPAGTFLTLDDVVAQAQALLDSLKQLETYRHPLDVRRGRKGVAKDIPDIQEGRDSRSIRAGSRTYFVDIEKTSAGKAYLRITESRYKGEGSDRERRSIVVFPEVAGEFAKAVSEATVKLGS